MSKATAAAGTARGRALARSRAVLGRLAALLPGTSGALVDLAEIGSKRRYPLESRIRALANPTYLGDHQALCRVLGRYKMYVDTRDHGLGGHLLLDGYWEIWLTRFIVRALRPGMVCVDVGAHAGYYTLLMADLVGRGGQVLAVEPNPAMVRLLEANISINGFTRWARVAPVALGDGDAATGSLAIPNGEPKNAALVTPRSAAAFARGEVIEVPVQALDRLAEGLGRIDFVKIDAEGAEADILRGMAATLRRDRPLLVVEFNAARAYDGPALLADLQAIYGAIHELDPATGIRASTIGTLMAATDQEDALLVFGDAARIRHAGLP